MQSLKAYGLSCVKYIVHCVYIDKTSTQDLIKLLLAVLPISATLSLTL